MSKVTDASAPRFVCRCEEIAEEEILQAIAEGSQTINDVKRRTRAGMGVCQGIYCVPVLAELIARHADRRLAEIVPMTARPPIRLLPLERLVADED